MRIATQSRYICVLPNEHIVTVSYIVLQVVGPALDPPSACWPGAHVDCAECRSV